MSALPWWTKYGAQMSLAERAEWLRRPAHYAQLARSYNAETQLDYDEELTQNDGAGLQRYAEPKP